MDELQPLNNLSDVDWCNLEFCTTTNDSQGINTDDLNITNETRSCAVPICPKILSYTINESSVRVYDLILLFCSVVFLVFLFIRLATTMKKLYGSLPLFRLLYSLMFLIPVVSCVYEITSLITTYQSVLSKLVHVLLRGAILMTELCVVFFGLFIILYSRSLLQELKLCGNSNSRLVSSVAAIASISVVFTIAEGILEFFNPHHLVCENYKFFTHGGMIFLFVTSIAFAIAYAAIFTVFILGYYDRWNLPSKKSFYRYALFLSLVNTFQAIGSFLWFTGKDKPVSGNAGICITLSTNAIYVATFAPVVYWIFLSNYFRMNSALKSSDVENNINVVSGDRENSGRKKRRGSNPLNIGKRRSVLANHTLLIDGSYGSSSSYGSLDEETFVRAGTPDSNDK